MEDAKGRDQNQPSTRMNAVQTRAVFSENLRLLLIGRPSVARVCREIGINRTQFNRYLSSESFPRPDVLSLICGYFQVDARILLEPLEAITPVSSSQLYCDADQRITDLVKESGIGMVDQGRLPQGIYNLYRCASVEEELASSLVCKVTHQLSGRTTIEGVVPRNVSALLGLPNGAKDRRLFGPVLQHGLGISFMLLMRNRTIVQYDFLEFSYLGDDRSHFGQSLTTHRFGTGANVVMPIFMARIEDTWPAVRSAVRASGILSVSSLPNHIENYLMGRGG